MSLRASTFALAAIVLAVAIFAAAPIAEAKPLYCDYRCFPPYSSEPSTVCTCPPGTLGYGNGATCSLYFAGYCDEPFLQSAVSTPEETVLTPETPEETDPGLTTKPESAAPPPLP